MNCEEVYSEITVKSVKGFRMARYVMISPNPEDGVNRYMDAWAAKSGLLAIEPVWMYIFMLIVLRKQQHILIFPGLDNHKTRFAA